MTDRSMDSNHMDDDVQLDDMLARAEEDALETLSAHVDLHAGLMDIFLQHPQPLSARRARRRSSRRASSKSQETKRP